jgi:hypothetical protein
MSRWIRLTPETSGIRVHGPMEYRHDSSGYPHNIRFDRRFFTGQIIFLSDAEALAFAAMLPEVKALVDVTDPKKAMGLTAHSTKLDAAYVEGWNKAMAKVRQYLFPFLEADDNEPPGRVAHSNVGT